MKLILINGQSGSGKTSVGKALLPLVENAVFIDVDSLVLTNPWEFGKTTDDLAIKNGISLINDFSEVGFENMIISGLTRNQELLDDFLSKLNREAEVVFIWLKVKKEIRIWRKENRARDGADTKEHFDLIDKVYPDIESINIKNGKSLFIDGSEKSIEDIAKEIRGEIN